MAWLARRKSAHTFNPAHEPTCSPPAMIARVVARAHPAAVYPQRVPRAEVQCVCWLGAGQGWRRSVQGRGNMPGRTRPLLRLARCVGHAGWGSAPIARQLGVAPYGAPRRFATASPRHHRHATRPPRAHAASRRSWPHNSSSFKPEASTRTAARARAAGEHRACVLFCARRHRPARCRRTQRTGVLRKTWPKCTS